MKPQVALADRLGQQLGGISDDPTLSAIFTYVLATKLRDAVVDGGVTAASLLEAIETAVVHAQQSDDRLVQQLRREHLKGLMFEAGLEG